MNVCTVCIIYKLVSYCMYFRSVKSIGASVFWYAGLTSVAIPTSVASIELVTRIHWSRSNVPSHPILPTHCCHCPSQAAFSGCKVSARSDSADLSENYPEQIPCQRGRTRVRRDTIVLRAARCIIGNTGNK